MMLKAKHATANPGHTYIYIYIVTHEACIQLSATQCRCGNFNRTVPDCAESKLPIPTHGKIQHMSSTCCSPDALLAKRLERKETAMNGLFLGRFPPKSFRLHITHRPIAKSRGVTGAGLESYDRGVNLNGGPPVHSPLLRGSLHLWQIPYPPTPFFCSPESRLYTEIQGFILRLSVKLFWRRFN